MSWTLWFAVLALLFVLVRRLAGVRAAAIGVAFLALHYAADVPLLWVSDTQDLLATAGALLTRPDPEIARLGGALADAIRRYLAELPPRDPGHPPADYQSARPPVTSKQAPVEKERFSLAR